MATIGGRAGRYVPEPDWRIMLLEQLFRAIERLWCWREFSVPVLAVLIAYKAHHPDLALSAGLLMVCVLVLLLFTRPAAGPRRGASLSAALSCAQPADHLAAVGSGAGLGSAT